VGLERRRGEADAVDGDAPTIVFTSAPATAAAAFDATRVRVEHLPASAGGIDLDAVLSSLGALECNEVLVEAGSVLAGAFVARGLADEVVVYAAPSFLGHRARAMLDLPALRSLAERQAWVWHDVTRVGPDLRLTLRPAAGPGRGS